MYRTSAETPSSPLRLNHPQFAAFLVLVAVALLFCGSLNASDAPDPMGLAISKVQPDLQAAIDEAPEVQRKIQVLLNPIGIEKVSVSHYRDKLKLAILQESIKKTQAAVLGKRQAGQLEPLYMYDSLPGFSAKADADAILELTTLPEVRSVETMPVFYKASTESHPLTNVDLVQGLGYSGDGITIAIIDDGIDHDHPAFGGDTAWPNAKILGGYDFADDDDNPRVDDDCTNQSHGTSAAGIAAGNASADGILGVAPEASLVMLKIQEASECGSPSLSGDVIAAIDWAVTNKVEYDIRIISLSAKFGFNAGSATACALQNPFHKYAVDAAADAGIILFAAAGNDSDVGQISNPACQSEVISVGAVYDADVGPRFYGNCPDLSTSADQVACYSNSDDILDILAPAHCATTAGADGTAEDCFGGTSAATPFAAGLAALLLEANAGEIDTSQMREYLVETGTLVPDKKNNNLEKPRVDAQRALTLALGTKNITDIYQNSLSQNTWGEVRVTAVASHRSDYYVRVWDSNGYSSPDWNWADLATSIVPLIGGQEYTFNFSVQPDSATANFEFWLYRKDILGLFKIVDKIEVVLNAEGSDTTPPIAAEHSPDTAEAGTTSSSPTVVFSESILQSSLLTSYVQVTGSSSGSHSAVLYYDSALHQLTIDPSSDFVNGETVTVSLSDSITDPAGNGLDGDGDGTPGPAYVFSFNVMAAGAPNPPTNLTAEASSQDQVSLSWQDQSADEDGFEIHRRVGSGSWTLLTSVGANSQSYTDFGLSSGTTYRYRVRAFNALGQSAYTTEASATPQSAATPPDAPSNLQAGTVSTSQIFLTWSDNSSDESGFKIERKDGSSGSWFQVKTVSANVTSWQSWGLDDDTTYSYRIRSYNSAGTSEYSNEAGDTTDSNAPKAPTGLTTWVVSSTKIGMSWNDRSSNENGFEIERRTEPGGAWSITGYAGRDDTTFEDFVSENTEYSFRVRAHNADGYSSYSNLTMVTSCAAPRAPRIDAPYNGEDSVSTDLTLEWNNDDDDASYDVYLSTDASPEFLANVVNDPQASDMTLDVEGLLEGTVYYWRVAARASCDPSLVTSSTVRTFSTLGAPDPVTLLKPSDGATDQPTGTVLDWENVASDGTTVYDLYLGTSNPPAFFEDMATRTEKLVTGLPTDTTHYWQVVAKAADDPSLTSSSPVWSFTTGSSGSTTVVLSAVQDAGLRAGSFANRNYGGDPDGAAEQKAFGAGNDDNFYLDPGNAALRGLVQFDLSSIPAEADILSATLTLQFAQSNGTQTSPLTMHFDPLSGVWSESSVTWNNRPGLNASHRVEGTFPTSGFNPTQNDLTALAQKWHQGTLANYGIQISIPEWEGQTYKAKYFYQKEWSPSLAAQLSVTYVEPCLAPAAAGGPQPADGATGQSPDVVLDWADVDGAANANVYFGTSSPPQTATLATDSMLTMSGLQAGTTYYWQVETLADCDPGETTLSPVWSFTTDSCFATSAPVLLAPAQSAVDQRLDTALTWDPVAGSDSYEVFVDTTNPPTTSLGTTGATSFTFSMSPETTYFWRIRARAGCNSALTTDSEVRVFTTASPPTADAGGGRTVEVEETTTLGGSPAATGGTPPYSYAWSLAPTVGATLDSATAANPVFTASSPGAYTGRLVVTDANGLESPISEVVVNIPGLSVTPAEFDFGTTETGTDQQTTFTVTNTGAGLLAGTASAAEPFAVTAGADYALAPGSSASVTVEFSPQEIGNFSGELDFTGGGGASRDLAGTGVDTIAPRVMKVDSVTDTGDGLLDEGEATRLPIHQLVISFSEAVEDADLVASYLLFDDGGDGFDTSDCSSGIDPADEPISIDTAVYDPATKSSTLNVNGGAALDHGTYRLLVCGTLSIEDVAGNPLDGDGNGAAGDDFVRTFEIDTEGPRVLQADTLPSQEDGVLQEGDATRLDVLGLQIAFDDDVVGAEFTGNYLLFSDGGDGFDTSDCASGVHSSDGSISVDSATYDPATRTVALDLNAGAPLGDGIFRLLVCSSGLLADDVGNPLDGDGDGAEGVEDNFVRNFVVDRQAPLNPTTFESSSHTTGIWSALNRVTITASGAVDLGEAEIAGYSIVFDLTADTTPDATIDIPHAADPHSTQSDALSNGDGHFFHLRVCDRAGNCSQAQHLGPFWIDTQDPTNPGGLASPSHTIGAVSADPAIEVSWNPAQDQHSGVAGYSTAFSGSASASCDQSPDLGETATGVTSPTLADGEWWFHLCTVDNAGNWSETISTGPFEVDTSPPAQTTTLQSTSHLVSTWSSSARIDVEWTGATDPNGVAGYSYEFDNLPTTDSDTTVELAHGADPHSILSLPQPDGNDRWFHLRACDSVGNCSETQHLGPFWVDTVGPSDPTLLSSLSHDPNSWSNDPSPDMEWQGALDLGGSGVSGYSGEFFTPDPSTAPAFQGAWGSEGSGAGMMMMPSDAAAVGAGCAPVFVVDSGNARVQKLDGKGDFLSSFGSPGTGDGQFIQPSGLVVDSLGTIYVSDAAQHRIQRFDATETFVGSLGALGAAEGLLDQPSGLAIGILDQLYVADRGNHRIQIFGTDGTFLGAWGQFGSGAGQFNQPVDVAVARSGEVFVADLQNHRIQKFGADGNFLASWGTFGSAPGEFKEPAGIAVDLLDRIYVTDRLNARIQVFTGDGTFLTQWGTPGDGDGELSSPGGLDACGLAVFAVDTANHRLQKFSPPPPDDVIDVVQAIDPHRFLSAPLSDGTEHVFHLRTCDQAGNCTRTAYAGPFWIDTVPPPAPALTPVSHAVGVAMNNPVIELSISQSDDEASSVSGFSSLFSSSAVEPCPQTADLGVNSTSLTSAPLADGSWYAHLCTVDAAGNWSTQTVAGPFLIDSAPPSPPKTLASTSHSPSTWSNSNQVGAQWSEATDTGLAGLNGYSVAVDQQPSTTPDSVIDVPHGTDPHSLTTDPLADGPAHTIHIRSCDSAGNCGDATHLGPFWIDTAPPALPSGVASTSHVLSDPSSDPEIDMTWSPGSDALSGVDGHAFAFTTSSSPVCDQTPDVEENVTTATSSPLGDGSWWFHLCTVDTAGNWTQAVSIGPFVVDTTSPTGPATLESTSHTLGQWSNERVLDVRWLGASDGASTVAGYSYSFDDHPATVPDTAVDLVHGADPQLVASPPLDDGQSHYFHLRTCDGAGNCSPPQHLGPFWTDATSPANPGDVASTSHDVGTPTHLTLIDVGWGGGSDTASGLDGYGYAFTQSASWTCDEVAVLDASATSVSSQPLADGSWWFHLCTTDVAGNWSEPESAGPFEIETPPRVTRLRGVASRGEDLGSSTQAAITQILISFDVEVFEADVVSSYRLLRPGANGTFETTDCNLVQGDDEELSLVQAAYDGPSQIAAVRVDSGPLADGQLRFLVCQSIEDAGGVALDGDGDGVAGGHLIHDVTVAAHHLLENPNFDDDLGGWSTLSPSAGEIAHGVDDRDEAFSSGSVRIDASSGPASLYSVSQCVELSPGDAGGFAAARARISSTSSTDPVAAIRIQWFSSSDCTGSAIGEVLSPVLLGDTAGEWSPLATEQVPDSEAGSARWSLTVDSGSLSEFTLEGDDFEFFDHLIFADGFESGDTGAW